MSQSGGNERVVVDPITRIEGHLRIEAQMNGGGVLIHRLTAWPHGSNRPQFDLPFGNANGIGKSDHKGTELACNAC